MTFWPLITSLAMALPPAPPPCAAAPNGLTPAAVLSRAVAATGMRSAGDRILHIRTRTLRELRDLSDRPYKPFDASTSEEDAWLDPTNGVEMTRMPGRAAEPIWSAPRATTTGADGTRAAPPPIHGLARWQRAFDALAVVAEWTERADAVVEGRCRYRDDVRIVLRRPSPAGDERLLLNELDGLPVALERTEPSYFMGPEHVEYLYYNWEHVDALTLPLSAMRIVEGSRDRLRSVQLGPGATSLVVRDSAPKFPALNSQTAMADIVAVPPEPFWSDDSPDTARVGPAAFLLVGSTFTSAVALAGDTVFILDATEGERRAQRDSAWIGRLFPGRHALAFVVSTDIWPHIAGLRYWVANGATVIVHPTVAPLVRRAIDRRWTTTPDLLERTRARLKVRIDTVRASASRAGGALRVFAVDGVASEGVLAVFAGDARFLWASDRVQDVSNPSLYVTELWNAARRNGVAPTSTSGPHLRAIPWATIDSLARK